MAEPTAVSNGIPAAVTEAEPVAVSKAEPAAVSNATPVAVSSSRSAAVAKTMPSRDAPSAASEARHRGSAIAVRESDRGTGSAVTARADAGAPAAGIPEIAHDAPPLVGSGPTQTFAEPAGAPSAEPGEQGRDAPAPEPAPPPTAVALETPASSEITAERAAVSAALAAATIEPARERAAEPVDEPGKAAPAVTVRSRSQDAVSPSALGRVKLVPRVVTRPGMGAPQPAVAAPTPVQDAADDGSGDWQSVSNPELKSGPWMPSGAVEPSSSAESEPAAASARGVTEPVLPAVPPPPRTLVGPPASPADGDAARGDASDRAAQAAQGAGSLAFAPSVEITPPDAERTIDEVRPGGIAPSGAKAPSTDRRFPPAPPAPAEPVTAAPSVTITGTPEETALALLRAAASADRERLFAARRADPDDPAVLLALLAHLGEREPAVRRELLDEAVRTGHGRAQAIALHELALIARDNRDATRATALWTRAYQTDPSYPPVWMPLADAFAASDDYAAARELYEAIAVSDSYDSTRRAFAAERAQALGRDDAVVSGEIDARGMTDLEEAQQLAAAEDWPGAIDAAERAAAARPDDLAVLEVLERIYLGSGNVTAASEAIGRQLMLVDEPGRRSSLWRRRARMYRDALSRDAEAYRCLKEAHACSPADPEIAYQLRTAAMVRGEWALAASLMYREIAAAAHPRDRGALHLELAMIYEERLDDAVQAQTNYEQALAFDPTIPAVKLPLARRYEAIGRWSDAARLYEDGAGHARPADRAGLLEAAARCRQAAAEAAEPDLAAQLDRAEAAGDLDGALDLAGQLWRKEPGHAAAFRVLAKIHRTSGDLPALTELTQARVDRAETPDERATAWLEVARLAEEIGALDQAARTYDLALIQDPGHISALDARGALAFRLGDFATADLIYRDLGAGESVLGDDELALRRSMIAEQLGRDSEALQLAQTAASLAPGRRDVLVRVQELATRIGELPVALAAARHVLELIPLDDDEGQLATQFALVELLRETGQLDDAAVQLERILRDHPVNAAAIEALAQVHTARGDWPAATRYLYQLVPLAPSPAERAERLYRLGEAVLVHLGDTDRADDVFLRASDLDPGHVPTLRRLLDVYWRADDPGGIVEVATELADKGALINGPTPETALARALIAAALIGDVELAQQLHGALGDDASRQIADALGELAGRSGRLQLGTASTAIAELARRGFLDLAKLRAATAGTPAANAL
ncbi:MAG: hypothetical protein E6J91_40050 [Deltaproteobacteria bacterium]|nr:MAG: hypothetical protein E6J91_40050 [Deltaproteobacteria bacterium]